ncbi:hypothetical protein AOQ84DRAFT_191258 [Glonium stellatum]|uniref:Uncharacterized protein n=1 Tax=Glonium stellatum TaxID=574774 RepID=A0A8E2JMI7_9PEZI|nr:hypothetical protein AOQ84DRAFT_191258 [Glonium stellatum]
MNQLNSLLYHFSQALQCRDDRDRVFAVLAVAGDSKELGIVPDYARSYSEVLVHVAVRMMAKKRPTPLKCWNSSDLRNGRSLPSWVPQWRKYHHSDLPEDGAASAEECRVKFLHNHRVLEILGIRLATIKCRIHGMFEQFLASFGYQFHYPHLVGVLAACFSVLKCDVKEKVDIFLNTLTSCHGECGFDTGRRIYAGILNLNVYAKKDDILIPEP